MADLTNQQRNSDDAHSLRLRPILPAPPRTPSPLSEVSGIDDLTEQETLASGQQSHSQQAPNHGYDAEYDEEHTGLCRPSAIIVQEAPGHSHLSSSNPESKGTGENKSIYRQGSIFSNWMLEFLALLVAAGLLVAMYLILDKYREKQMPDWDDVGITLNTLIAILSTLFRAALVFVAFEVLTQLKWDWVSTRFRPMHQFQLFDDASRGVYGSLRLIPVIFLHQPMAIVAIVIVVLSFGIGPFVQQTIQPYPCLRPSESSGQVAAINAAIQLVPGALDKRVSSTSSTSEVKIGLKTAMQDSLVNPSTDSNVPSMFTCTSGNCTFSPLINNSKSADDQFSHASIGMCSRCIDVSELVEGPEVVDNGARGQTLEFRLPAIDDDPDSIMLKFGPSNTLMSIRNVPNLTWAHEVPSDQFLNLARWSIANISILASSRERCERLSNGRVSCPYSERGLQYEGSKRCAPLVDDQDSICSDYFAATCIVYPCIKYYSAKVENTTLFEETIRDVPLHPQEAGAMWSAGSADLPRRTAWSGVQLPCVVNGTLYTSENISESGLEPDATRSVFFHAENWETENIQHQVDYVNITAPRECVYTLPGNLVGGLKRELVRYNATCYIPQRREDLECFSGNSVYTDHLVGFRSNTSTSLDTITENFESITRRLTTEMRRVGSGAYSTEPGTVLGKILENRTCVHITFSWLLLPLVLLVLSSVLLLWIIVRGLLGNNSVTWKSSLIPLLLRDHSGLEHMGMKEIDKMAKGFELNVPKHKRA